MPFAKSDESGEADNSLTLYQSLFEMARTLCEAFPALTPFSIRRERAREVFLLIKRINTHPHTENGEPVEKVEKDKAGRIRRPAGDNWF